MPGGSWNCGESRTRGVNQPFSDLLVDQLQGIVEESGAGEEVRERLPGGSWNCDESRNRGVTQPFSDLLVEEQKSVVQGSRAG